MENGSYKRGTGNPQDEINRIQEANRLHEMSVKSLTKREYFAVMAMQSLINTRSMADEDMCEYAVKYADILLKELEPK